MISLFQRAEIRRLFYAEHWPIGTIADAVDVHHETVRRALNRDRGIHPGPQIRPSALDPYKAFITATLEQYLRRRATRLWAMLRDRGYPGSAVQVRRSVRTVRPTAAAEAFFRLEPLVGEQGQVDWGNFGMIPIGRARRVLSCFVLVLSWSRAVYARFALDHTLGSFLRGHVEAFTALGGVPPGRPESAASPRWTPSTGPGPRGSTAPPSRPRCTSTSSRPAATSSWSRPKAWARR